MDPLRRLSAAERFARARELRHNSTPAERHAWTLLRNRGILWLKFRRQHVLHGFIVDFYCPSERIVIELEGNVHDTEPQRGYDEARTGSWKVRAIASFECATEMSVESTSKRRCARRSRPTVSSPSPEEPAPSIARGWGGEAHRRSNGLRGDLPATPRLLAPGAHN